MSGAKQECKLISARAKLHLQNCTCKFVHGRLLLVLCEVLQLLLFPFIVSSTTLFPLDSLLVGDNGRYLMHFNLSTLTLTIGEGLTLPISCTTDPQDEAVLCRRAWTILTYFVPTSASITRKRRGTFPYITVRVANHNSTPYRGLKTR